MKWCLRGQAVYLPLIAIICPLIIWAWVRNPLLTSFPVPTEQFEDMQLNMLSPVFTGSPIYTDQQPPVVGDKLNDDTPENPDNAEPVSSLPPIDSSTPSTSQNTINDSDMIQMPTENKGNICYCFVLRRSVSSIRLLMSLVECNYAKGKWIPDNRRPLYTGFSCNQWLSEMWACRRMKRPDFFYESFRWQPYQCTMREFDRFKFLRRMQDKTIALVGDSLGRQQFQSLMCMVTGGKENHQVQDVGKEYGLVKARGALRPDGWAYRFPNTNTTILYYWSASLCELEPLNRSDPATGYAMHLDRPATFLTKYLQRFDVLVLNTGHHWNRVKFKANRWVMYVGGAPCTDKRLANLANAKNLTVYSVAKWLDSQLPRHPRLKGFFRTMSPRHFVNGDWNTGGSCDNLTPLAGESEVSQDGSSDTVVEGAVKGTKVNILDITALSQLRDEGHISKYTKKSAAGVHDCLHWCLPGIPDTWNEILAAQL